MKRLLALAAFGVALLAFAPSVDARSDWYCGAMGGTSCGLLKFAKRYGGHIHSWHNADAAKILFERPKRVVLGGHSIGCKTAMNVAWQLARAGIAVDVFFCFDGVNNAFASVPAPPPNIRRLYSWFHPAGLGGARFCTGKMRGNVCTQWRGRTFIYEEMRPDDGHIAIGGYVDAINAQVARAMAGK